MAGNKHEKTEAPTQKKKKESRKEGRAARSPDLVAWTSVLLATMVLPGVVTNLGNSTRQMLATAVLAARNPDPSQLPGQFGHALAVLMTGILPLLLALGALAIVGSLAQVGFIFTGKPLKPKFSRLNPGPGLKKMFSTKGLWQAAAASMKLTVIGVVVWIVIRGASNELLGTPGRTTSAAVSQIGATAVRLIQVIAAICVIIGLADYTVKRRDHNRELRMTKHEVRQEYKDAEGDPHVRSRMRSNRLAMSRNRMIGAVIEADVVITNPTHFAVAISYHRESGAPKVVARGADANAAKIREEARRHGVPCVESPPLARTLHRLCRPGEEIPTELYQAVATVLAFIHRLGEAHRSYGGIIGLDVADSWTPSDGALERIAPKVRQRRARQAAVQTRAEVGRTAHSPRKDADRTRVNAEIPRTG